MPDDVRDALAACPLFAGLPAAGLQALSARCRPRRLARGRVIFAQGDAGDALYVLTAGAVTISVRSPGGGEVVLGVLRAPQAFGEIAVVDGGPRVAGATAATPVRVVAVPREAVLTVLRGHPEVGAAMLSSLVAMVRHVDEQAADLALLRAPQRVAKALLAAAYLAGARPTAPGASTTVDLAVNQTELARQVGASRQAVNRALMALERAGAIERKGAKIVSVRTDLLGVTDDN